MLRLSPLILELQLFLVITLFCRNAFASKLEDELREQFDYFKGTPHVKRLDELHRKYRGKLGLPIRMNNPVNTNAKLEKDERSELASATYADSGIKYQGDIILTPKQFTALLAAVDNGRTKRKVIKGDQVTWPSTTINYQIDSALDAPSQTAIKAAIKRWEENTCMRFVQGEATNYLNFFPGVGCYSTVGFVGGRQGISIGLGCGTVGIVAHEIGHSLGFWHEQSRPDRDEFVSINYDNVLPGTDGNFQKNSVDISTDMGQPYDLGSIMHYGPKAFSESSADTITTLDPKYQNTIGQRKELSFIDVKQANLLYCSAVCGNSVRCSNAGYPDPHNCQQCKCPTGFGGRYCTEPAPSVGCSGTRSLVGTTRQQILTSGPIRKNMDCSWLIKCNDGGKVNARLTKVSFYCRSTCYDFVEIKSEKFARTGSRFCCESSSSIVSTGSTMAVIMETTDDARSDFTGFTITYFCSGGRPPVATTRPPVVTTRRPPSRRNEWGTWGSWSFCSATCGMCGDMYRTRQCRSGNDCSGTTREQKKCGDAACPVKSITQEECDTGFKSVQCNFVYTLEKQVASLGGRLEEEEEDSSGGSSGGGSGGGDCSDSNRRCAEWANKGECPKNDWMPKNCRLSCGICQRSRKSNWLSKRRGDNFRKDSWGIDSHGSHEHFGRRKRGSGRNGRTRIPYNQFHRGSKGPGGGGPHPGSGSSNWGPDPHIIGPDSNGGSNRRRPSKCRVKVYFDCSIGTDWIPRQESIGNYEIRQLLKDFRNMKWEKNQRDRPSLQQGDLGSGKACCTGFQKNGAYCQAFG